MAIDYAMLFFISVCAFTLKGLTGFGPTIIIISFGSLFIAPHDLVATASLLDLTAGAVLLKMEWDDSGHLFWFPLVIAIVAGSIVGAILLNWVSIPVLYGLMTAAILLIGLFFLFVKSGQQQTDLPFKSSFTDQFFSFLGGFFGGLVGIDGPPLIWHFGRKFSKQPLRKVLVPVFFAAAMARVTAYTIAGLFSLGVLKYALSALPGLFLGILLGNFVFLKINEAWFKKIIGLVLVGIGLTHLFN